MTSAEWSDGALGPLLSLYDEITDPGRKWQKLGRCGEVDPDLHHPGVGRTDLVVQAKAICAGCEVRVRCLEFALDFKAHSYGSHGIFGGTTPEERDEIRRQRRNAQQGAAA